MASQGDEIHEAVEDQDVSLAVQIVRNPSARATARRYSLAARLYLDILKEMEIDPENFDCSTTRNRKSDPVAASLKLILNRCGPKENGFEGLSAGSTGAACKSAVVAFWRSYGHQAQYAEHPDGSFSGNPGTSPELQNLIDKLQAAQMRAGTHLPQRAYQQTHEDVRKICTRFFDTNIIGALECASNVDYTMLQSSVINCVQFGSLSRSDEVLSLRIENIFYSGDTLDSSVAGIVPSTKTNQKKESYVVFERAVHRSFCPLEKFLLWKAVLIAHGILSGPVFVKVVRNTLQPNQKFLHTAYASALKLIAATCGIPRLQEHSARRGGLGYQYFVLKKDLLFLRRKYNWESIGEMINYLGLDDDVNSYALLGFSDLKINES